MFKDKLNSGSLTQLPRGGPFSLDLRDPDKDDFAKKYCNKFFGRASVDDAELPLLKAKVTAESIREGLLRYNVQHRVSTTITNDPTYELAVQSVRCNLNFQTKLSPLTLGGAEKHPDFPRSRSPGLPYTKMGYETNGQCIDDPNMTGKWHRIWDNVGRNRKHSRLSDCLCFFRAQTRDISEDPVWGYPLDVTIEEARFFLPLIGAMKQLSNSPFSNGKRKNALRR